MNRIALWVLLSALTGVASLSNAALLPPAQARVMRFTFGSRALAPAAAQLELGAEFTIETWLFMDRLQGSYLLGKNDPGGGDPFWSYMLMISGDGHAEFHQSTGRAGQFASLRSPGELPLRKWTHLAATLSNGTLRLYVNGVEVATGASPGPPAVNPLRFGVGGCDAAGFDCTYSWFEGALRQVRVWRRALGAGELQANAVKPLTGSEAGLAAWWPLDDGGGQTARDRGPNGLALQRGLTNAPEWNDPGWIHTAIVDNGPYFELEGPFEFAPGCDKRTIPCLGAGAVIDFNSDGAPDLVLARVYYDKPGHPGAPMLALRNDGHGRFSDVSATVLPNVRPRNSPQSVVADFNGDGRDDLWVGDQGPDHSSGPGGQNRLLYQTVDGRLEDVTESRVPLRNVFTHTVCAGDFTGDGRPELFTGPIFTASIPGGLLATGPRLLRNDGSGSFSRGTEGLPDDVLRSSNNWSSVALDANRDGHLDLAIGGGVWEQHDTLLLNDGHGRLLLAPETSLPSRVGSNGMHMTSGDLDGDGWSDLLHWEQYAPGEGRAFARVSMFLNNRDGTFRDASQQIIQDPSEPQFSDAEGVPNHPKIADFNGDGLPDFMMGLFVGLRGPRLFLNMGGGHFVEGSEFLPMVRPGVLVHVADFDRDGRQDIVLNDAGYGIFLLRQVKAPEVALLRDPRRRAVRHP